MHDDVLLKFLHNGLIDVGGDDEKLARLRETAVDLSGVLRETPAKATSFALVAFDPDVPPTDPTIVEVEHALQNRWETYVNTFSGTPVLVIRAMLLDALVRACVDEDTVAAAFVASARNMLPFTEAAGEQEIWSGIVRRIEGKVEERCEREWATPASISIPNLEFGSLTPVKVRIRAKKTHADTLTPKFEAAAGPQSTPPGESGTNTDGNPVWPQNDPARWVFEFGTRTAQAVAEAINRATGGLSLEGLDLPKIIGQMTTVVSGHLTTTLVAVSQATAGLQRRTNLLWWKEALFSPSAGVSYRRMSTFDAAVLMAFDMHRQVPTFSPASVAAFLRETVSTLPSVDQERKIPIHELVEKTQDADDLAALRAEVGRLVTAPAGRGSILRLIGHPRTAKIDERTFRDLVGVQPHTMLALPDWSVWIFRELQATRAIAEASALKHPTSPNRTPKE